MENSFAHTPKKKPPRYWVTILNRLFNHLATIQRSWYLLHHGYTFPRCRPRPSLLWNLSRCLPCWKNSHSRCHDYEIANLHAHTGSMSWVINSTLFPQPYTLFSSFLKHKNRPPFDQQVYGSRDESGFSRILNLTGCAQGFMCRMSIFLHSKRFKKEWFKNI